MLGLSESFLKDSFNVFERVGRQKGERKTERVREVVDTTTRAGTSQNQEPGTPSGFPYG